MGTERWTRGAGIALREHIVRRRAGVRQTAWEGAWGGGFRCARRVSNLDSADHYRTATPRRTHTTRPLTLPNGESRSDSPVNPYGGRMDAHLPRSRRAVLATLAAVAALFA